MNGEWPRCLFGRLVMTFGQVSGRGAAVIVMLWGNSPHNVTMTRSQSSGSRGRAQHWLVEKLELRTMIFVTSPPETRKSISEPSAEIASAFSTAS